jgi:hypothetical protein
LSAPWVIKNKFSKKKLKDLNAKLGQGRVKFCKGATCYR